MNNNASNLLSIIASTTSVSFLSSSSHIPSLLRLSMHSSDDLTVFRNEASTSLGSWFNVVHVLYLVKDYGYI